MRLSYSAVMSVWRDAVPPSSVPWRWCWMVGSDASSETAGSSSVKVVGKTRLPATPWANAPGASKLVEHATAAAAHIAERYIEESPDRIGLRSRAAPGRIPVLAARG